jgi:F0F1-type ATP synthase membrane subunit b/b'
MDRTLSRGLEKDRERDMIERANARVKKIMSQASYEIDADRRRAIEELVRHAEQNIP